MVRREIFGVAAVAAAALLLETTLTRLLAVAQFYHFAFLVVSLALLGFGASGTLLTLAPRLHVVPVARLLAWSGAGFAVCVAVAYAVVNITPFDSYSLAWDRRQIAFFVLYFLALTLPFLCSGLGIGAALARSGARSHLVYAANLLGSAAGVLLAPILLELAGVPGAVLASALVGLLPAAIGSGGSGPRERLPACWSQWVAILTAIAALVGIGVLASLNASNRSPLGMTISPYKGLAHARRYPGATTIFGRWSAISRADVIADAGTRNLPGLSYTYGGLPPPEHGLSLDADSLQPVPLVRPEAFDAAAYMPEALAFQLRPLANVLVLEPAGGLGVLQALAPLDEGADARQVTAVIDKPLVRRAVASTNPDDVYAHPQVRTVPGTGRQYLRQTEEHYDIIFVPLTDAYRPVTSGAYSLAESYGLTVEAFADALARLSPDGVLVVTRWIQMPPSEDLRLIATLAEALERQGVSQPDGALIAYRGIQTITALVQPDGWSANELARLREFTASRRYDLVWAPDIRPEEANRFNRTPTPAHFEAVRGLFTAFATERARFYANYPFAITPPTDDRPFFFHFFRWSQTPQVLATLGRTWQPFGGSGYFVLLALLALVLVLSALLIIAPLALRGRWQGSSGSADRLKPAEPPGSRRPALHLRVFAYFSLLGLAFLFVEIPLIQRWILLFGHATYAFTVVVLALLLFSSLGSLVAGRVWRHRQGTYLSLVGALTALVCIIALATPALDRILLSWPLVPRALVAVGLLAPPAFLMGLPFPVGLAWLDEVAPRLLPWAWAVNGCASVVASVLAALFALGAGFTTVLLLGGGAYAAAGLLMQRALRTLT